MPHPTRDPSYGDTIIRPELTREDCAFLNAEMNLAGCLDRFGVGSANRRMEAPPDFSWVTFDLVGP